MPPEAARAAVALLLVDVVRGIGAAVAGHVVARLGKRLQQHPAAHNHTHSALLAGRGLWLLRAVAANSLGGCCGLRILWFRSDLTGSYLLGWANLAAASPEN